ncbi:hypothetical protein ALC57_11995, partial [Trachymyrmex cornetzi]
INLSSVNFPSEVQGLLQLKEGFCLPPYNVESITIEYIKHIENNLFIRTQKDKLPSLLYSNVVYKINCQNCDRIEHNHDFDWNNIKILDKEQGLGKKLILGAIYIIKKWT